MQLRDRFRNESTGLALRISQAGTARYKQTSKTTRRLEFCFWSFAIFSPGSLWSLRRHNHHGAAFPGLRFFVVRGFTAQCLFCFTFCVVLYWYLDNDELVSTGSENRGSMLRFWKPLRWSELCVEVVYSSFTCCENHTIGPLRYKLHVWQFVLSPCIVLVFVRRGRRIEKESLIYKCLHIVASVRVCWV